MHIFVANTPSLNHFMRESAKKCCVPSYVADKPSLNHFMQESAKKHKKPQKRNLSRTIKNMNIVFNSNHFNKIIYTK